MIFYDNLFSDMENTDEIINMINEGKAVYDVYLICIPQNSGNLMNILTSYQALKEVNRACKYTVIGMAKGKENAFALAEKILEQWLDACGDFNGFKKFYTKKI